MNPFRGIVLKVSSVAVFVAMASLVKVARDSVPPGEAVFFRSFFAIPVILVWLAWTHDLRNGLKTANPIGHFWRGLVGTSAMVFGFAGLGMLPLPEVTAIGYAAPILTVIFAAMFLGETIRLFRIAAVGVGMLGVLVVLSPRLGAFQDGNVDPVETLGAVVVLMGAAFGALAATFVRKLIQTETTASVVFWFSVTASLFGLMTLPFGWVMPGPGLLLILIATGLLGGLGQILLTSSYRHADAGVIAPFEYASMLLTIAVGWFVFSEVPTTTMLIGAGLIILAGVAIIWREQRLGLERRRQRGAGTPGG